MPNATSEGPDNQPSEGGGKPFGQRSAMRGLDVADLGAIVGLVFVVVLIVRVTTKLAHVSGLLALAVTISYLTAPLRTRFASAVGRGAAAAFVALFTLVCVAGVAFAVSRDVTLQATRLGVRIDQYGQTLIPKSLPGRLFRAVRSTGAIQDAVSRTGTTVVAGQPTKGGLTSTFGDLFVVVILGAFFQTSGTQFVNWCIGKWPREERAAVRARWQRIDEHAGSLFRTAVGSGLFLGSVVAVGSFFVGVRGGVMLGAWAGLWATVGWLGIFIGFMPFLISVMLESEATVAGRVGLALLVAVAISLQLRLRPTRLSTPGTGGWVLGYAIGYALAGVPGLLLAMAAVSFVTAFFVSDRTPSSPLLGQRGPLFWRADTDEWWRTVLTIRGASIIVASAVCGTIVWGVLSGLGQFAAWVVIGTLLAVGMDRAVRVLLHKLPVLQRGQASVIVCTMMLGAVLGVALLATRGGATGASLSEALPRAVQRFESQRFVGPFLRSHNASEWAKNQLDLLPTRVAQSRSSTRWLPALGARLGDLFWTLAVAVALLLDGPRLLKAFSLRVPVRGRRQFGRLVEVAHQAVGGYLAGSAIIAGFDAAFVLTVAIVLGVPLAPALAGWAFVTNFIPQVGGLLGGAPLVVLAFTVGPGSAAIALVLFVLYQLLENHVFGPIIIGKAVDIPPVASLLAALVGGAAWGMVGALVLTPLVGVVRVSWGLYRSGDLPGQQVRVSDERAKLPERANG